MARIRSVKPEFWTSEQVVELSPIARLLFIGLWNFCDDGGNHPASCKTLKMQVFPGDDFTVAQIDEWVNEMKAQKLLVEYEADGKQFWHVTGWEKHQRPEKPQFKYPKFPQNRQPVADQSESNRQPVADQSTGEKEKEKEVISLSHAHTHEAEIFSETKPDPVEADPKNVHTWAAPQIGYSSTTAAEFLSSRFDANSPEAFVDLMKSFWEQFPANWDGILETVDARKIPRTRLPDVLKDWARWQIREERAQNFKLPSMSADFGRWVDRQPDFEKKPNTPLKNGTARAPANGANSLKTNHPNINPQAKQHW
jgi:hypothetical protein